MRTILQKQYRLKTFVCASTLIVCFISFNFAFVIAYSVNKRIIENQARAVSRSVSQQTSNMLFQLMEKGWTKKELGRHLAFMEAQEGGAAYKIKLYRKGGGKLDSRVAGVLPAGT